MFKIKAFTQRIPRSVYLLGVVSFFNDVASEMLYPIMPIFLTQLLGAPVFVIGIIDGVAEGLSAFLKMLFGSLSDTLQRRKPFVVSGYGVSVVGKVIIALATNWPVVFVGRVTDRLGKGVRTGARDAMLLAATNAENKGLIFGVHRSFDSAGAVVGPLLTLLLLQLANNNIRTVLYIATIPALITLIFFLFIKEAPRQGPAPKEKPTFSLSWQGFPRSFQQILLVIGLFSLGNSSDSFLILRGKQLGLTITGVVLAYVVYNLIYTLLSTPAGIVADRLGASYVFAGGLLIYGLVYTGFAFNQSSTLVWVLFAIYGAYMALTDGVSKALIGSFITPNQAGAAYGVTQTVMSLATLLASFIGGALWSLFGAAYTFFFGAGCAFLALVLYLGLIGRSREQAS